MSEPTKRYYHEPCLPGLREEAEYHSFSIDELLYEGRSDFQDILLFDNDFYGRVLVLDGIVQLTELDEFVYHEMLVHPVLFSLPEPARRILIVGGGDGGSLRECLRHDPEEVVMVDIDEQVVRLCRQHLPSLSRGAFESDRLTLIHDDASRVLRSYDDSFDCIIVDCGDDIGPSSVLFGVPFYRDVRSALRESGACSFQVGSFLELEPLRSVAGKLEEVFRFRGDLRATVPAYTDGDYSFMTASMSIELGDVPLEVLEARFEAFAGKDDLRYYSPAVHKAAQVLPRAFRLTLPGEP